LLLEWAHFLCYEFVFDGVHSHINDEALVSVQECGQGVHGALANGVEAQIDNLELCEARELVEELNGSFVCDTTLLKS